ncbi:glycosyltransferase [Paenibacillus sp. FSL W7-1287]|uniref:glycosyltransferase n=1 Tax=Paenibacillus sp. FSL W7-1287 TaxID=2954538 RepID=UPI0030F92B15
MNKDYSHIPTVTVMVVAHNEEKVILEKLNNVTNLDYPKDKLEILIASDNSTDRTNGIVQNFISENQDVNVRLYQSKERKGKTNAQNEAFRTITSEYIVMTDANSMLAPNAVKELMASFTSADIAYVAGKLAITNQNTSDVSKSEVSYWDGDLFIREIEARMQTITAGNGALYACRTSDYYEFDPIESHDSAMPLYYALQGKRAICNHDAIAYEKAGEVIQDEFNRKVRMNRKILQRIIPDIRLFNVFKYKWFSYFYFGHRTCRYLLWLSHSLLLISSVLLISNSWFFLVASIGQIIFFLLAILRASFDISNKYINMIYYYCVTIVAQWLGVINIVTGKAKPFWEKAESTR